MFCGSELVFPPDKQHVQVPDCQKVKMSQVWLWLTLSLPSALVGQHLGAGGLPGQRTPRTGDPRQTFFKAQSDLFFCIMALKGLSWKEGNLKHISGCILSVSVSPGAYQNHPSKVFPKGNMKGNLYMNEMGSCKETFLKYVKSNYKRIPN